MTPKKSAAYRPSLNHIRLPGGCSANEHGGVSGEKSETTGAGPRCSLRETPSVHRGSVRAGRRAGQLPKEQHDLATTTLRAAWKLGAKEGMLKIEPYAEWLEREWHSTSDGPREGLAETCAISRLNLTGPLCRCRATTNLIDLEIGVQNGPGAAPE